MYRTVLFGYTFNLDWIVLFRLCYSIVVINYKSSGSGIWSESSNPLISFSSATSTEIHPVGGDNVMKKRRDKMKLEVTTLRSKKNEGKRSWNVNGWKQHSHFSHQAAYNIARAEPPGAASVINQTNRFQHLGVV